MAEISSPVAVRKRKIFSTEVPFSNASNMGLRPINNGKEGREGLGEKFRFLYSILIQFGNKTIRQ
jgi:hypothetical protein